MTVETKKFTSLFWIQIGFFACLGICALLTLIIGDSSWNTVWKQALERIKGTSSHWNPLLDERIPRLIVILCSGAALAVAGAVMQSLFNNPLASPNVLGISCGGGLMVILVFVLEWHLKYPFIIPLGAFLGSLLTLVAVYLLSRSQGIVQLNTLILTGIAVSSLLFAIQAAIMYALRDRWMLIQTLTEWESGSTIDRGWKHVHMQLPLTLIGLYGCWHYRSEIDILALGEEEAQNLGVEVNKVRWRLFLCVALLTGGAIASVGAIAFFGLVLPHLVRYLQGPSNHQLIPLCILIGSTSFAAIDLFLRIFEIHSLSIGNVAAILGGFFFLILITRLAKKN
ncbi:MAG: iron ABC transporter permease [Parachlamydiaceae bacterium]|nr:iron ABC transporter permease [Parachlamydiaceae bacterium]